MTTQLMFQYPDGDRFTGDDADNAMIELQHTFFQLLSYLAAACRIMNEEVVNPMKGAAECFGRDISSPEETVWSEFDVDIRPSEISDIEPRGRVCLAGPFPTLARIKECDQNTAIGLTQV